MARARGRDHRGCLPSICCQQSFWVHLGASEPNGVFAAFTVRNATGAPRDPSIHVALEVAPATGLGAQVLEAVPAAAHVGYGSIAG